MIEMNRRALAAACALRDRQPRADYTADELASLPLPVASTDLLLAWRNGDLYNVPLGGMVLPIFNALGVLQTGAHMTLGAVTASGASSTIAFAHAAAFSTGLFFIIVVDLASGAVATITASSLTGVTFTSVAGHGYAVLAIGI